VIRLGTAIFLRKTFTPKIAFLEERYNILCLTRILASFCKRFEGTLFGLLVIIGIVVILVYLYKKQQKQQQSGRPPSTQNLQSATEMKFNDKYEQLSLQTKTRPRTMTSTFIPDDSTIVAPQNKEHCIPFNELIVDKIIGEGRYGKVYLGKWNKIPVALKFCGVAGSINEFIDEANIMISLPPHPNVIQMYGVSHDGPHLVLVLEYCPGGSLDKLLFDEMRELSEDEMLKLVRRIAAGLRHLHSYNIIHRDLAARNILLSKKGEPKIADLGMSRLLVEGYEGQTVTDVGPVRWMAPESLKYNIYSRKSDVWMFGIVVYEIVARSEPHPDIHFSEVSALIQ